MLFRERVEQALETADLGSGYAVLRLDLDYFKPVIDMLGHATGHILLVAVRVADRLLTCVRQSDTVARRDGDEFAVILPGVTRPNDAALIAKRIISALHPPFDVDGYTVSD